MKIVRLTRLRTKGLRLIRSFLGIRRTEISSRVRRMPGGKQYLLPAWHIAYPVTDRSPFLVLSRSSHAVSRPFATGRLHSGLSSLQEGDDAYLSQERSRAAGSMALFQV